MSGTGRVEGMLIKVENMLNSAKLMQHCLSDHIPVYGRKVDMRRFIDSLVDCEFSDNELEWSFAILKGIDEDGKFYDSNGDSWAYCRPRLNHINFNASRACPVPPGVELRYQTRDGVWHDMSVTDSRTTWYGDVIAFEIIGNGFGYTWS